MAGRTLTIDIKTTDAQTLAALRRIQKELKDTGNTAERTGKQGLGMGDALAGIAVGAGLKSAVDSSSNLAEAQSKVNVVFGASAPLVERFGETSSSALGQSEAQALEAVGTFGNLLRAIGLTEQQSADYSMTLTTLASDLASFNNTSVDEALTALRSGLVGETEPLKRFGVNLNEATLKAQALKMGLSDGKSVLDANTKAQAAYALILEQTSLAQGDFERTSDGAANQQRILAAEFENAKAQLGDQLMPAFKAGVEGLTDFLRVTEKLPEPVKQGALALAGVAFIAPKVARGYESIREATTNAEGATTRMGKALGAAGIVAAAGAGVFALNEYREATSGLKVDIEALLGATDEAIAKELMAVAQFAEQGDFEKVGRSNIDALYAMRDAMKANGQEAIPELTAAIKVVEAEQARAAARSKEYGDANAGAVAPTDDLSDSVNDLSSAMGGFLANADQFAGAQDAVANAGDAVNQAIVGVADAQSRVVDAEEQVATAREAVADAEDQVASAREGVAAAEENLAEAHRGVEEAQRGVTEAEKDALAAREDVTTATEALAQAQADAQIGSDYMADALEGVADAEERLALSQADSQEAQEALTEAREGYSTVLADLAANAAGAADDVLSAEIRLREAQQALAELGQDGKPVSADDRTKAEIAIREAQRRLDEARRRAAEAAAEERRQREAGVEGSDAVVAAQDAVTEAAGRQEDAQRALEDAVLNVADTQEEANNRVADAQDNLAEAIDKRAAADQRVVDARQAVVDANGAVQKAAEGVRDANGQVATAIDGVRDAQQRVTDAKEGVKTARGEVEAAERKVEEAVKDQYQAYKDLSELFAPGSAARTRMEWLTSQLQQQYGYLTQPITVPFVDLFGGRSATGPKSGPAADVSIPQATGPAGKTVTINAYGIDDPAATAEWIYARAGWELGLMGVA